MVRISLLGHFAAATDEGPIVFEARSAAALVAFVALARDRSVSRDAVAAALWPGHEGVSARTNLRKAIQRVRKATPGREFLVADGEELFLRDVETDLDRADRLHRTFLLATRQPEGTASLAQEWEIRSKTLLAGWDDEWIVPHRERAAVTALDLGSDLARSQEAMGELAAALDAWREILARVPHHAMALQNALRLEKGLHGPERAADFARSAQLHFRDELGIEMPHELRRALRDFGLGGLEPVPPPDALRKRSELYLLARMFESNLASNRTEALSLLARECTLPKALEHPRAMLSLLTLALERTEGGSPERLQIASIAVSVASWTSEFEVGHRWCDFVIGSTDATNPLHGNMLSMRGFMIGEAGDFPTSRDVLAQAHRILLEQGPSDEATRAAIRLAGPHWHLLEFETSIGMYDAVLASTATRTDTVGMGFRAAAHGNLCFVYSVVGAWEETAFHGRETIRCSEEHPSYGWIVVAPLGLALLNRGERVEGLRMIRRSLANTLREGMPRFNQICLDYAAVALAVEGREHAARCLLDANVPHQAALRRSRSLAEAHLVQRVAGIDPSAPFVGENPLRGQSAATLSEWACEELDRLAARVEA